MFDCVSSGSCQERTVFQCLHKGHSCTLLSETTKRQDGFLNRTRVEKHSNCPSFWKFVCHQSSSVMLESSSTCCVDSRITQRYLLSSIREWTGVQLCSTVKKRTLGTNLSPCGHGIERHKSTLEMHESSPTTLGSCEGYDTVEAVSEG